MNERPRKTLDWDEPREVLAKLLSESSRQPTVASTD
jgi:IS30 family transposase